MRAKLTNFIASTDAATAIEYSLLAALIGLAALVGASSLGGEISKMWNANAEKVAEAMNNP